MFSSMRSSVSASPGAVELHNLSSSKRRVMDDELGAFVSADSADENEGLTADEDEVSSRYHRVDSIDEFGSERVNLMPVERGIGQPIMPDNNLDKFFREMYEYYMRKGFGSIVSTAITNLTSFLFAIVVTTVLLTMFNWSKLSDCRDDSTRCEPLVNYIESPFNPNRTSLLRSGVLLGSSIATLGWFWMFSGLFFTITSALRYRSIYRVNNVYTRDLQTMSWSRVVTKLKEWQNQVFYVKNEMQVNAFTIALRIMRKENFKIATFCMNVLPLGSPTWATTFYWVPYTKKHDEVKKRMSSVRSRGLVNSVENIMSQRGQFRDIDIWYMGRALETNLDVAIFNQIVDEKTFTIRKDFNARSLRAHLKILAVLNLIFLPLIFLGTFVHFFFRYAEEFHSKKIYLGPRWWTPHAMWVLREFNELPHVFQRRLYGSLRLSEKYLRMFPSPVPIVLARGIAFILGGLVAILLVFAFVDDAVLLHVSVFDRNLVWYAAVLSSALAASRALIPPPEEEAPGNPNVVMRRIAAFTHLLPDVWRGKAHTYDVKEQFEALFAYRVHLLFRELICVVCTPYILGVVLPEYADDLVKFIKECSTPYSGVGDVCTFSLMNLKEHGDPKWNKILKAIPFSSNGSDSDEDGQEDDEERMMRPVAERALARRKMDVLVDSKLEKSWIAFKIQYSADNCGVRDDLGEDLLRRVRDFKQSKKPAGHQDEADQTAYLMSSSVSALGDAFELVPPSFDWDGEEAQTGAGEEIFWFLEQFRDEELRKRSAGL